MLHCVLSQCSASVNLPEASVYEPTATQLRTLVQATELSTLRVKPGGFGEVSWAHTTPVLVRAQRSTSVAGAPDPLV
jgi:hypothetical protein